MQFLWKEQKTGHIHPLMFQQTDFQRQAAGMAGQTIIGADAR